MLVDKVSDLVNKTRLIDRGGRILVGVSGGPDSMCLLHLLLKFEKSHGIRVFVAHLNHGFREEAAGEASFVQEICRDWKVPFYGARINVPLYKKRYGLSSQEAARLARYRFYEVAAAYFNVYKVALGHHRDDQVETVLLNILYGSGLDGLGGMKAARRWRNLYVIRPLLEVSRDEIELYCEKESVPYITDRSNLESLYRRNKIRRELLPYLEKEFNPRIKDSLSRLTNLLSADRDFMESVTIKYFKALARISKGRVYLETDAFKRLPLSLKRRIVRKSYRISVKSCQNLGTQHVERLINLGVSGKTGKEVPLPGGGMAYKTSRGLVVKKYLRSAITTVPLKVPGRTYVPGAGVTIKAKVEDPGELPWPPGEKVAYLDYHKLSFPLFVRSRQAGDRFVPLGLKKRKKLKDFFIDQKIPRRERDLCPLVVSGDNIAWVAGQRISNGYKITGDTRRVLVLEIE